MSDLARELQDLIDRGLLMPAQDASRLGEGVPKRERRTKTFYNIGDVVTRGGADSNAQLETGARGNTNPSSKIR